MGLSFVSIIPKTVPALYSCSGGLVSLVISKSRSLLMHTGEAHQSSGVIKQVQDMAKKALGSGQDALRIESRS